MKGIDVSKHQGNIDWAKVKADEIDFAIIRAGYGMYPHQKDPCFQKNVADAKAVNLPVGAYWYSYAVNTEEAVKEAEICLQILEPYKSQITLPVFFDQEYEPRIKALTKKLRTEICLAFMDIIKLKGYRTGLYCSYDWYKNWVDRSKLTQYPVWIAQYGTKCQYTEKNLVMWQYTSAGRVSGISGNVDLDTGYDGLFPTVAKDGWYKQGDKWRYSQNGKDVTGWQSVKGIWYYLDSDGFMVSDDWRMLDNRWYYLTSNGAMARSWRKIDGWWYYFNLQSDRNGPNGSMLTGIHNINGKMYCLNEKGSTDIPLGAMIVTDYSGAITLP